MSRRNTRKVGPLLVAADGRTPLTAVMWRCSKCRALKTEGEFTITDAREGRRRAACKPCEATRLAVRAGRERASSGVLRGSSDLQVTVTVRQGRPRCRPAAPKPYVHRFFPLGAAVQRLMQEA